jgi:hypothetical protein
MANEILCLRFLPYTSSEGLEPDSNYMNGKGRCNKKRPPSTRRTEADGGTIRENGIR